MRLFRKPAYLAGALLGLGLLLGGSPARADVHADFTGTSPGPGGCTYFNYDITVTGNGNLKGGLGSTPTQGNFFTFYDIPGFSGVADVIAPAGFVVLAQNTGFTPANTAPVDAPGLVNVTFVNDTGVDFDATAGVDVFVGTFSICSSRKTANGLNFFAGSTNAANGTRDNNIEQVAGPVGVPEPGALVLALPGLLPLGLLLRKRRA